MALDNFHSDVDRVQSSLSFDSMGEVDSPDELFNMIDDFQEEADELQLDDSDLTAIRADEDFLESLNELDDNNHALAQRLEGLTGEALDEFVDLSISKHTEYDENWRARMYLLDEMLREPALADYHLEIEAAMNGFVEVVVDRLFDSYIDSGQTDACLAISDLLSIELSVLSGMIDLMSLDRVAFNNLLQFNVERLSDMFETSVEELMGGDNYLNGISDMPFDYSERVVSLSNHVAYTNQDLADLGLPSSELLSEKLTEVVGTYEETVARLSDIQEYEAITFYEDRIVSRLEEILADDSLSDAVKFDNVNALILIADAAKLSFMQDTPSGRLTQRGVQAFVRIADTLVIALVENGITEIDSSQRSRLESLIVGSELVQYYFAQSTVAAEMGSATGYFEYSVQNGFMPNAEFLELSVDQQNDFIALMQTQRVYNNIDIVLQSESTPEDLRNYYTAVFNIQNGEYEQALDLVNELIESGIGPFNEYQISFFADNLGLNIDDLDQRLLELRSTCLQARLNDLENLLLAASPNASMALHSAASIPGIFRSSRGFFIEHAIDTNICNIVNYFTARLRSGLQANMTWEEAYERAVAAYVTRPDHFSRQGFSKGMADSRGFDLWQLVRDYNDIQNLPASERRQAVLQLAERVSNPSETQDRVGMYGLTQQLLLNEFRGDLEQYYRDNRTEIEMDIQDVLGARREVIIAQLRVQAAQEYGDEWADLPEDERNEVLENMYNRVCSQVRGYSIHSAAMIHLAQNIPSTGRNQLIIDRNRAEFAAGIQGSMNLVDAADLFDQAANDFNRIQGYEELVEPLLVTAITTAIALPLGAYLSGAGAGILAATRIGQAGRIGELGILASSSIIGGGVFNITNSAVYSALYSDVNFLDGFDPRSLGVEVISDGIAISLLGSGGRVGRLFREAVDFGADNFSAGARIGRTLRDITAGTLGLGTEASVLTGVGHLEGVLAGQSTTFEESGSQALMMMLMMRSIGRGAMNFAETSGYAHGESLATRLPNLESLPGGRAWADALDRDVMRFLFQDSFIASLDTVAISTVVSQVAESTNTVQESVDMMLLLLPDSFSAQNSLRDSLTRFFEYRMRLSGMERVAFDSSLIRLLENPDLLHLNYFHGTNSSTLGLALSRFDGRLMPSGVLISNGGVPMTGEILYHATDLDAHVSGFALSGVSLRNFGSALSYARNATNAFLGRSNGDYNNTLLYGGVEVARLVENITRDIELIANNGYFGHVLRTMTLVNLGRLKMLGADHDFNILAEQLRDQLLIYNEDGRFTFALDIISRLRSVERMSDSEIAMLANPVPVVLGGSIQGDFMLGSGLVKEIAYPARRWNQDIEAFESAPVSDFPMIGQDFTTIFAAIEDIPSVQAMMDGVSGVRIMDVAVLGNIVTLLRASLGGNGFVNPEGLNGAQRVQVMDFLNAFDAYLNH